MSKMIRVESCGGCDHESESDKLCLELIRRSKGTWKIAAKAAFIIDETKILPNCPLENYKDIEPLEDKLDKIKAWCKAYPVTMFPKPDLKKAAKALKDNGMRLDDISASNMRHVLEGVQKIIEEK